MLPLVAEGNGPIENLFDQKIELNALHKRLDTDVKPLEDKLAAAEKARADVDIACEVVVASKT